MTSKLSIFDPIAIDFPAEKPQMLIRTLSETSWEAMVEALLSQDSWHERTNHIRTPEDMRQTYLNGLKMWEQKRGHPLVVLHPQTREVMGVTSFVSVEESNLMAEMSFTWIAKRWQRTFVQTALRHQLLRHLFEVVGYRRIEIKVDSLNEKAKAALLRCSFHLEGMLRRRRLLPDGESRDFYLFSITDLDWPDRKAYLEDLLAKYRAS